MIIGADQAAVDIAASLQREGFDIRAIRPPTVPEGTARLRIALTLNVNEAVVTDLFDGARCKPPKGRMTAPIIVVGTDTGVGKTVFSAALAGALGAAYWKPIQSGLLEETDTQTVLRLSGLSPRDIVSELYRLRTPASPHLAAEIDGITIDIETLALPDTAKPLVVEAAGGLLVPLTRLTTYIELIARWRAPVVLCARTTLGTINHSLLSIEALRARGIPLLGHGFHRRRKCAVRSDHRRDGTDAPSRPAAASGRN